MLSNKSYLVLFTFVDLYSCSKKSGSYSSQSTAAKSYNSKSPNIPCKFTIKRSLT